MNSKFTYFIFLAIALLPSQAFAQSGDFLKVQAIDQGDENQHELYNRLSDQLDSDRWGKYDYIEHQGNQEISHGSNDQILRQSNFHNQSKNNYSHISDSLAGNQIIHVNPSSGKDNSNGSRTTPVKTISQALTMAKAHTVIILNPGNYNTATGEKFPLILPDQVTIQGSGDSQEKRVIIQGNGDFTSENFGRQNVTLVMGDHTRLTGVTVNNQSSGFAIWLENIRATLTNNTLTSQGVGLAVEGTSQVVIQENNFLKGKNGMLIGGTAQGEIRDNLFEKTGQGITVTDQAKPLIVGNRLVNNQDGIFVTGRSQPVLRGNYLEKNQRDGIVITEQALPDIGNTEEPGRNTIRDNGRYDLHNAITHTVIPAYGNLLESDRLQGKIDVIGSIRPVRSVGNSASVVANARLNSYRNSTNNVLMNSSTSQPEISQPETSPNLISQTGDRPYLVVPNTVNPSNPLPANQNRSPSLNRRNLRNNRPSNRRPATSVDNGDWSMPNADNGSYDNNYNSNYNNNNYNSNYNSNWNNNNRSNTRNNTNTTSLGLLPVPSGDIPIGSGGYVPPGLGISGFANNSYDTPVNPITVDYTSSRNRAIALGLRYRVVVDVSNSQQTQTLLSIVPDAFKINIAGRNLMQAGAYQDRGEANQLLQILVNSGLPARIETIR